MKYTEADLPVTLKETETIFLGDGTEVRYEENGGARDVFTNAEWSARASLFPGMEYLLECTDCCFRLLALDSGLRVEKMH